MVRRASRRGLFSPLALPLITILSTLPMLAASVAQAATVTIGNGSVTAGQTGVGLPLTLTVGNDERISAMTVDLRLDPSVGEWKSIVLAPAAIALGKRVAFHPLAPGQLRVVVYGVDHRMLNTGQLAECRLNIASAAIKPTTSAVTLVRGVSADPEGNEQALTMVNGQLHINPSADTQPPEITGMTLTDITANEAVVSWKTSELAKSAVIVEQVIDIHTLLDGEPFAKDHRFELTGLTPNASVRFRIVAIDQAGNRAESQAFTFHTPAQDTVGPTLTLTSPARGAHVPLGVTVVVAGTAVDDQPGPVQVRVNNQPTTVDAAGRFSVQLPNLSVGSHTVIVEAFDQTGNRRQASRTVTVEADNVPPTIQDLRVANISTEGATVSWQTSEPATSTLEYGTTTAYGQTKNSSSSASTAHQVMIRGMASGAVIHYRVRAVDPTGNVARTLDQNFTTLEPPDSTPPMLTLEQPLEGVTIPVGQTLVVSGSVADDRPEPVTVTINGSAVTVSEGQFTQTLTDLEIGSHTISIQASDLAGNRSEVQRAITVEAPADTTAPKLSVMTPEPNVTVRLGEPVVVSGRAVDDQPGEVRVTVNDIAITRDGAGRFSSPLTGLTAGPYDAPYDIVVVAVDQAGNRSELRRHLTVLAPTPVLRILTPVQGAALPGSTTLTYKCDGVVLRSGDAYQHVHLQMDQGPVWHVYNSDPFRVDNLPPGTHTVRVDLVDNVRHGILTGLNTSQQRTFTVPGKVTTPPPPPSTIPPPVASPASVQVVSPALEAIIRGKVIDLRLSVAGVTLRSGDAYHHLHIQMDQGPVWHVYGTEPFRIPATPGRHTITIQLVDNVRHFQLPGTQTAQQLIVTVVQ